MKAKDLATQNGFNVAEFENWVPSSGYPHRWKLGWIHIDDNQDFNQIVSDFRDRLQRKSKAQEELERKSLVEQEQRQQKQKELAGILITSGFTFDGYTITKYSGYISGDDVIQVPREKGGFWAQITGTAIADAGTELMKGLVQIRRKALTELKEAALALGCNAVIGVDFDYITLDPETAGNQGQTIYLPYVFGVTANGNAVVIEKNR